ncbi:MAG TPA: phage holin family protein [Pyrinomonadaceae bacterium]|nr:phage holin family protein [Pyrinomonadaceae bacterium]
MAQQQTARDERSIGDLFSELAGETTTLVRQEIALAQTELTQKAVKTGKNVGFLVVGGAIAYAALLAVLAAIIIGLGSVVPLWASALIVGAVVGIVAAVLIFSSLNKLKNTNIAPQQSIESLKEDAQWLKKQV